MKRIPLGSLLLFSSFLCIANNAKGQDTNPCHQLGVDCHPPRPGRPDRPDKPTRQERERELAEEKERAERAKKIAEEKDWCQKALDKGNAVAALTQCSKALDLAPNDSELQLLVKRANMALADVQSASRVKLLGEDLENWIEVEKSRVQGQHASDSNAAMHVDSLIRDFEVDTGQRGTAVLPLTLPPMPPQAAELVAAMNSISAMPIFNDQRVSGEKAPLPKGRPLPDKLVSINCQTFFRALGEELKRRNIPSWYKEYPLKKLGEPNADGIVENIANDPHWKKLDNWQEAQARANQGSVVIGGQRARSAEEHGHLAVVFPAPPVPTPGVDLTKFTSEGDGPFVRDGNEHHPKAELPYSPSTWGAVRASRAMSLPRTSWYVWVP